MFLQTQDQKAAASFNSSNDHLNLPPVPTNTAPRPTGKRQPVQIVNPGWSPEEKNQSISSSMYSSSDSGFIRDNIPEVDYDDDEDTK